MLTTPAFLDDVNIKFAHLEVGLISSAVAWQWQIREHEVQRSESVIQVIIELRKRLVQGVTNFLALQRPRGRKDGDFLHDFNDVEIPPFVNVVSLINLEVLVVTNKILNFFLDHTNISAKVVRRKTNFDKFLLFHENLVRDVIDNVFAENRSCKML